MTIQPPHVTLSKAKGLRDSSVAEFTLSEVEVLPPNDKRRRVQGQGDKKGLSF